MNKLLRLCVLLLMLPILLSVTGVCVFASSYGFPVSPADQDVKKRTVDSIRLELLTKEPKPKTIRCFDVNENGLIAIGSDELFNVVTVWVYSSEGAFQYGYRFTRNGTYGLRWEKDTLLISLESDNLVIAVDPNGNIRDVAEIPLSVKTEDYFAVSSYVPKRTKTVDGCEYRIKNRLGFLSSFSIYYTQITVTNKSGEENVIFDAGGKMIVRNIISLILVVLFMFVIKQFVDQIRKTVKNNKRRIPR